MMTLKVQGSIEAFTRLSDVIDFDHPLVAEKARELAHGVRDPIALARRSYEWVRDEIRHSWDHRANPVTCSASKVLEARTGFCYSKSHLLAALLRANRIPAGFCYQRLSFDGAGPPFSLHGLNAVFLPEIGWYRIDPRGNRHDVDAQFVPPIERLAFPVKLDGEFDFPEIWPEPMLRVVQALQAHKTIDALAQHLPDIQLDT